MNQLKTDHSLNVRPRWESCDHDDVVTGV